MRDLAIKSGVSVRTLYKHQELWKKEQEDLQKGLELVVLESVVHEYNAGVLGASATSSNSSEPFSSEFCSVSSTSRSALSLSFLQHRQKKGLEAQATQGSFEMAEKEWRDRVACLVEINVLEEPLAKVKALVNVLGHLLLIAPCVEDSLWLSGYMQELRVRVSDREKNESFKLKSNELMGDPNSRFKSIKFMSF